MCQAVLIRKAHSRATAIILLAQQGPEHGSLLLLLKLAGAEAGSAIILRSSLHSTVELL
jgi:hypothetical protein